MVCATGWPQRTDAAAAGGRSSGEEIGGAGQAAGDLGEPGLEAGSGQNPPQASCSGPRLSGFVPKRRNAPTQLWAPLDPAGPGLAGSKKAAGRPRLGAGFAL